MPRSHHPAAVPARVRWAVELLELTPSARVLEIGCGAGHAVALLCERLTHGHVTAIDRSALQVAWARERNAASIASGAARIEPLSLVDAPSALGSSRFDCIVAINVNAFWTTPGPSLGALAALLAPYGRACLVYEPPSTSRVRELRKRVPAMLVEAGLRVETVRVTAFPRSHAVCIIGRHGSGGSPAA